MASALLTQCVSRKPPPYRRQQKLNLGTHESDIMNVYTYSYARQKVQLGVDDMSLEYRHRFLFPDFPVTKDYSKCLIV